MVTKVVGSNMYQPNQTPTQGQNIAQMNMPGLASDLAKLGVNVQIGGQIGGVTPSVNFNILESLSTEQLATIAKMLKKMGYSVKANRGSIKNLFYTEPELAELLKGVNSTSRSGSSLINALSSIYIPIGSSEEPALPTRTITEYDPKVLSDIIDKVYLSQGKRRATAAEKKTIIDSVQEDIRQGTLTTTKKVKNPKTGKMENVTTVQSAFSQNKFESQLEQGFAQKNPQDFDISKRIDFNKWLMDNMPSDGGM